MGTYILASLTALGLLSELEEFIPARFGPNVAIVACFIAMLMKDTEKTRHAFFTCYFVGGLALLVVNYWMIQRFMFAEKSWTMACQSMKEQGKFKDYEVANMQECEEKMGRTIETIVGAIFLLMVLIQFHFFGVVYAHYRNYAKESNPSHQLQDEHA